MATTMYVKHALTGGDPTALDSISYADLNDGDGAWVFVSGVCYNYVYDDDNGGAESSPDIITPDDFEDPPEDDEGRWVLQTISVGTVYGDFYVDASDMYECTTNGSAAIAKNEYGTNDIDWQYFAFDDDGETEERVQFKKVMQLDWDLSTIKAKFYWSSATSSSAGDTVEWGIKAGALADSDAIDTALGTAVTISDTLLADNGADLQITSATAAMTVAGTPTAGEIVTFEIYRNTDGTDDMEEDAWLFGVHIQYGKASTPLSAW